MAHPTASRKKCQQSCRPCSHYFLKFRRQSRVNLSGCSGQHWSCKKSVCYGSCMMAERLTPLTHGTPALAVSAILERDAVASETVDTLWAAVTLDTNATAPTDGHGGILPPPPLSVDFVLVVDASASMQHNFKLVHAAIDYLLRRLDSSHRVALVIFNQQVRSTCDLSIMTDENKAKIYQQISSIEPSGATNIIDALLHAVAILNKRPEQEQRLANVMLFTDGLSSVSYDNYDAVVDVLTAASLPANSVINTFGFGEEHDSLLLYHIALCGKGVYYYVDTFDSIGATFGECIAGILSTRIHGLVIKLRCQDGARLVTLGTPYPITEQKKAKDYDVFLGLMYYQETKSLLFRLSLRKFDVPMERHNLVAISVEYTNSWNGVPECHTAVLGVARPPGNTIYPQPMPLVLDEHINRYTAARALTDAINLSKAHQWQEAQMKLEKVLEKIGGSFSSDSPYCRDLIDDVKECLQYFKEGRWLSGMHSALTMSSMYFMERSVGMRTKGTSKSRTGSYGYTTIAQFVESQRTTNFIRSVFTE